MFLNAILPANKQMKVYYIAGGAICGALAIAIRLLQLKVPFILVPYLEFELAEIPILAGFLLYGPTVGVVAAFSYWGILNMVGSFVPIGPAMAFTASLSTVVGMWLGLKAFRKLVSHKAALLSLGVLTGIVFRVIVTTISNYIVIWLLFPFFFEFASQTVSSALGMSFGSQIEALIIILALTALFNVIQVIIITIPSLAIVKTVKNRVTMGKVVTPWITRILE